MLLCLTETELQSTNFPKEPQRTSMNPKVPKRNPKYNQKDLKGIFSLRNSKEQCGTLSNPKESLETVSNHKEP